MNKDLNNIHNEITENERYTFCYTPDECKEIFRLCTKKAKRSSILLTVLLIITSIILIAQYDSTYGTFMILFALIFAILQIYRFADAKRKSDETHKKFKEDIDIYEIAEDKIIYSNITDGELTVKCNIPYGEIVNITENDKYLQFQYENKIYSLKKSELKADSALHDHVQEIKARMKIQSKYTTVGAVIALIAIFSVTTAGNLIYPAENYFMRPSDWIYFPFLIFPAISLIYAFILKKKNYPYLLNLLFGIIMSIILIVCGCNQFAYSNFRDSFNLSDAKEIIGTYLPSSDYCNFYTDNNSDDKNIEIICESYFGYYTDLTDFDFDTAVCENPVWLDEMPDEFIDVIPSPEYFIEADNLLLYNTATGEINKVPTENGEHRLVLLTYYDYDYAKEITVTEYTITL